MNLRTALARMFGPAAIFAVLAFALLAIGSTAARAHPGHSAGHDHKASAPIVKAFDPPGDAVSLDRLSTVSDHVLGDASPRPHDGAELHSAQDTAPADDRVICLQGCCAGAPCHSGTACTLGPDLSFLMPHDGGISLVVGDAPRIAGHDPEGLRKPPKSFA